MNMQMKNSKCKIQRQNSKCKMQMQNSKRKCKIQNANLRCKCKIQVQNANANSNANNIHICRYFSYCIYRTHPQKWHVLRHWNGEIKQMSKVYRSIRANKGFWELCQQKWNNFVIHKWHNNWPNTKLVKPYAYANCSHILVIITIDKMLCWNQLQENKIFPRDECLGEFLYFLNKIFLM